MKGILLSLMAIVVVSGMTGAAYASFDSANNQNDFSDEKVDLKLKDQDESWGDGVSETWTATNMAPGDEFAFDGHYVGLRGDFPGKVEITCDYNPWTGLDPDKMAKHMVIARCIYGGDEWQIDCLTGELTAIGGTPFQYSEEWHIQDVDGDGRITFYDLKQSPLTNLRSPHKGGDDGTRFEISVKFHEHAGNEFQGDTFNLTMIHTLKPGQAGGEGHQNTGTLFLTD